MRILVTGANGYLGRGIVKKLLDCGNEVIATDINTEGLDNRAKIISCNLFEIENVYDYFDKPDALLHLAWRDGFMHYSDAHINDLPKHYKLIKSFSESGIKKIAVMGSMHEIGFYEGSINENTPCRPCTPYGISKNALRELSENLCKKNNNEFQWFRGYYIVSNEQFGNSIFSKISLAAKNGQKSFPFTTGQNQYDFLDYSEFCNMVATSVLQSKVSGVINICSGKPEKLADRVERFIKENGYDIELIYGAFPDRTYDSKAIWGDNKKINCIMNIKK